MQSEYLPALINKVLAWRRGARIRAALAKVATWPGMNIIDIGCGVDGRSFEDYADNSWNITGVDLIDNPRHTHPGFKFIRGDASDLSMFMDRQFDLAVSVGMLEHVTDDETFSKVVREMQRVARQYVIIVPWRGALIEPHYPFPMFGALPEMPQIAIAKALNLCGHREILSSDPGYLRRSTRWLSRRAYLKAFPGARIHFAPTLDTIAICSRGNDPMSAKNA